MRSRLSELFGERVHYFESIDSTNSEARRMAAAGAEDGTLLFAETQTSGKGRRGRSWVTPVGSAIAMSLILRPDILPANASKMTLIMGLAVAKACEAYCGIQTQIKWPNDVVAEGKKICGILTEMNSEADRINYVIIGTGINTRVEQFPPELEQVAVSLHDLTGKVPDRAELAYLCIRKFDHYYERFLETQDLTDLMQEYNELLAGKGGPVRVLEPGNEYCGISEGINEQGELRVRKEDGSVVSVYAGEVSVRGIYGYI